MSGRSARAQRATQNDYERHRARCRRVLDRNPLPPAAQAQLRADAAYMAARLLGQPARPPTHWSREQIAAWARILADSDARSAVLAGMLRGWERLSQEVNALPDDDAVAP